MVLLHLLLVEGASLLQEGLTLGGLSTTRAESFDTEGLTGGLKGGTPFGDLLARLAVLGTVRHLPADDFSCLVLNQVSFL